MSIVRPRFGFSKNTKAKLRLVEPTAARAGSSVVASEKTNVWCLISLNVFLFVAWLKSISFFLFMEVLPFVPARADLLLLGCYPILLGITIYVYERYRSCPFRLARHYLVGFGVLIVILGCYGLLRGNSPRVIVFDVITYITVIGGFVMGRNNRVWADIRPLALLLTLVSVVLAFLYTDREILRDRSIINEQSGAQFESVLTLAPLLCLVTVLDRKSRLYWPLVVASFGCLTVYLYFGRRGISSRCALELVFATIVLPIAFKQLKRSLLSVVSGVFFVVAMLTYFPFDVLKSRFEGNYGVYSSVVVENERFTELQVLAQELGVLGVMTGRGLGGAFLEGQMSELIMDDTSSGGFGRITTHAGMGVPILKGGLILWVLYFGPLLYLVLGLRNWRLMDHVTLGSAISGAVMLGFQFIEGTITYSTPWVSFGIGLIMARSQNLVLSRRTI